MSLRGTFLGVARALVHRVKRRLGLLPDREPPAPPPAYLETIRQPPAYTDHVRPGTVVFVLWYATRGSGGMVDILRLGEELRRHYGRDVYYTTIGGQPLDYVRSTIRWVDSRIPGDRILQQADFAPEVFCATAWPTAYEALARPSRRKLYFVQDYEPWFHKAGVSRYYAARSYDLGLETFTLGPWLTEQLRAVHGLTNVRTMPFPCTETAESGRPLAERPYVSIYLQQGKAHRGTELLLVFARRVASALSAGGTALELVIFGSAENEGLAVDFPARVRGVLTEPELRDLLGQTRISVCVSFTNLSLVTMRALACGCLTMDLDLPNVTVNIPPWALPLFKASAPDPASMLAAFEELLRREIEEPVRSALVHRLGVEHGWPACADAVADLFTGSRAVNAQQDGSSEKTIAASGLGDRTRGVDLPAR